LSLIARSLQIDLRRRLPDRSVDLILANGEPTEPGDGLLGTDCTRAL
jgi:hypothetical protein